MRRWACLAASAAAALMVTLVGVAPATAAPAERTGSGSAAVADQQSALASSGQAGPESHGYCTNHRWISKGSYGYLLPSIGTSGSTHCILTQGAQNRGVRVLQQALVSCHGLNTGGIDGIFGPATYNALRTAQSRLGITVDGVYGPQTRNALSWPHIYNDGSSAGCHRV